MAETRQAAYRRRQNAKLRECVAMLAGGREQSAPSDAQQTEGT